MNDSANSGGAESVFAFTRPSGFGYTTAHAAGHVRLDREERGGLGLIAEEVANIEPLLATYNKGGHIEGIKYDQIAVVLVNLMQ